MVDGIALLICSSIDVFHAREVVEYAHAATCITVKPLVLFPGRPRILSDDLPAIQKIRGVHDLTVSAPFVDRRHVIDPVVLDSCFLKGIGCHLDGHAGLLEFRIRQICRMVVGEIVV